MARQRPKESAHEWLALPGGKLMAVVSKRGVLLLLKSAHPVLKSRELCTCSLACWRRTTANLRER